MVWLADPLMVVAVEEESMEELLMVMVLLLLLLICCLLSKLYNIQYLIKAFDMYEYTVY
jgi:hypothetical protein